MWSRPKQDGCTGWMDGADFERCGELLLSTAPGTRSWEVEMVALVSPQDDLQSLVADAVHVKATHPESGRLLFVLQPMPNNSDANFQPLAPLISDRILEGLR